MATKERPPADRSLPNLQSAADLPWTGAGADRNSQNPWLGAADLRSRRMGNHEHQSTSTNQGLGPEPDRQVRGCYKHANRQIPSTSCGSSLGYNQGRI